MNAPDAPARNVWQRASEGLNRLLYGLSVVAVPLAIAFVSILALFAWDSHYPAAGRAVEFRAAEESRPLTPVEAMQELRRAPLLSHRDTDLSESPFWIVFGVQALVDVDTVVEFPSRHARELSCWLASDLGLLGEADRRRAEGRLAFAKAGYMLNLGRLETAETVLCRMQLRGPGRITALQWAGPDFEASIRAFHRDSGLLDGGLMVLSVFVLVMALINREWIYVLFAAWLVANLRLAAISAGWDTQWLGQLVPPHWLIPMRKATTVAYYVLTITLFARLFRDDLRRVGYPTLLRIIQWSCLPLAVAALALPYSRYLPVLWTMTTLAVLVIVFYLARILLVTGSRVAAWYAASLAMTLFATLFEVAAAAFGMRGLLGIVNSVTAALSSSLLAALAIAEQLRQEREDRRKAQAALHHTYVVIPVGLFTLSSGGFFLQVNPAMSRMLGVRGQRQEHWHQYFEQDSWQKLRDLVATGVDAEFELPSLLSAQGERQWFLVRATLANDKIEGSLQDITERVKATQKLRFFADHDALTGILNRRGIEEVLNRALAALGRGQPLVLAYIDLDRFKLINDLFGHAAGDEVLCQICDRINEVLAEGQQIGRVGGDEFVIVFNNTDVQTATLACRSILARIGEIPYHIGDRAFQVRGSIGLVELAPGTRIKDIISVADRACREAKNGHHGHLVVYERSSRLFREREDELRLVARLGADSTPDGLFLMMQPIMSLKAPYQSLDFEALIRLREADGSVTQAGKIIRAAEANGCVSVIDRWVLSTLLQWLCENGERLDKTRFVCMNLSGGSLNDERFVQDAFSMLAQYGRSVERLCIEITESVALHDLANTRRFIDRVRSFGCKIALDDFGAGYTSFSYLKGLQADALKIDGAFIKAVNVHPANLAIVEAIVELARNLGMKSIAEWVEDRDILKAVARAGADYAQGYGISRPLDPRRIILADSAGALAEDEQVALFVRDCLVPGEASRLWDDVENSSPAGSF